MSNLNLKRDTRLVLKEWSLPLSETEEKAAAIPVIDMPDAHLSCGKCSSPYFEVWIYKILNLVKTGCPECNSETQLLLPLDSDLSMFDGGRLLCKLHPNDPMVVLKNSDRLLIGCKSGCVWGQWQIMTRPEGKIIDVTEE